MTRGLGRSRRNIQKINYQRLNKTGIVEIMAKPKRQKTANKNSNKKKKIQKTGDPEMENNISRSDQDEENIAGPSNTDNAFEIVDDLHSDMGRGSNSSERDTSDVDSDAMEEQNKELQELNRQIEEKRAKRSNKEKRE